MLAEINAAAAAAGRQRVDLLAKIGANIVFFPLSKRAVQGHVASAGISSAL